ncbi:uncharacterized protein LOC144654469 isoform X2 [Oculina patagonica]
MSRRISPNDLVLPVSTTSDEERGTVNSTFSLRDQTATAEYFDGAFYEAIYRFLILLCELGAKLETVQDLSLNTPLHIAAKNNYVLVAEFVIERCPSMLLATNGQGELPVETAIRNNQDEAAAFLIRQMDHRRVKDLFRIEEQGKASLSIVKITEEFKLQKTILAVLDCLISPRWPHPPCLPSDIVPCLSWEQLQDTPTHFHVTYDILESDVNGRFPDNPKYEFSHKSCLYNLANHCHKSLDTVTEAILNHAVLQLLTERKWRKYSFFWHKIRAYNYLLFICVLAGSLLFSARLSDNSYYSTPMHWKLFDAWIIIMTLWFMCDEISEFKREPLGYIKDPWNHFDMAGYVLISLTFSLKVMGSDHQWTFASFAFVINSLGIFKYSVRDRYLGLYVKCLGTVIYRDMPRFLYVFGIIVFTFTISYYLALKANDPTTSMGTHLVNNRTLRKDISCTGSIWCVTLAGVFTWLEGTSITSSFESIGWQAALLILAFMMCVTIILLNILIAQLSLTYELVQGESLHSFTALRMQTVATIEWQSRFKFWNVRKKYYVSGEIKPRAEVEGMLKKHRESSETSKTVADQLREIEQRSIAMESNLQKLRNELLLLNKTK